MASKNGAVNTFQSTISTTSTTIRELGSPSLPITTIASLPAELLLSILENIPWSTRVTSEARECTIARAAYPTLRSAALVCRTWARHATALLHHKIVISSDRHGRLLLASEAFGKHQTAYLELRRAYLEKGEELGIMTVEGILSRVQGAEHLCMFRLRKLNFSSLCSPNLKHLLRLDLNWVGLVQFEDFDESQQVEEECVIPFSLRTLLLEDYTFTNTEMFTCFNSPSLTTLDLGGFINDDDFVDQNQFEDLLVFLKSTGAQLESLSLHVFEDILTTFVDRGIFSLFVNLRHFRICYPTLILLHTMLPLLPSHLDSLTFDFQDDFVDVDIVVRALTPVLDSKCLEKLQTLRLQYVDQEDFERESGGNDVKRFLERLSARGTVVEIVEP